MIATLTTPTSTRADAPAGVMNPVTLSIQRADGSRVHEPDHP